MNGNHHFLQTCVSWPWDPNEDGGLSDAVENSHEINRYTFLRQLSVQGRRFLADFEHRNYGDIGLTMSRDRHVCYFSTKLYGVRVYYFDWSGIEHFFVPSGFRHPELREAT